MNANLEAGSGFWFESQTGYLVCFSNDSKAWCASYFYSLLVVPPFEHPLHTVVVRHEVQHALTYSFLARSSFLLFLWKILFHEWFLQFFEELWVAYRSQTLRLYFSYKGNLLTVAIACSWILFFVYALFSSLTLLSYLVGAYIGITFIYWRR